MSTNTTGTTTNPLSGDIVHGDFKAILVVDPEAVAQLSTGALAAHERLARLVLARLAAEVDVLTAELARRRSRETGPRGAVSPALDVRAAAALLGVSVQWVRRHADTELRTACRRVGRRVTFDAAALARWRDRQRPR